MRVSLDDIYSGKNRSEIKYGNPRDEFEAILADDKIREAYLLAIGNRQDNITSSSQVLDTLTSLDHDPAKILNDLIGGWVSNYKQKIIQQNDLENSFKNLKIKEIKDRKDNVGKMFMDDLSNFIKDQDNEIDSVILRIQEEKKMKELQRQKLIAEKEQKKKEEERKKLEQEEEQRKKAELLKQQELARKRKEEELKIKKQQDELKRKEEEAKGNIGITNFSGIEKDFFKYKQDIIQIKETVKEPLFADKALKQATNKYKRKINPKFGQLTNSGSKLNEITNEIYQLISEVKSQLNELAYNFILNFIAKEIISQAEVEIIVKPQHSIPLAKLALNLLILFPDLKYYLIARFVKKCPYLIGYTCSIDTEEGRLRMGWKRRDNKWEEETKYNERIGGIVTLYSVMTRLSIKDVANDKPHPLPISYSWLFLSRLLNLPLDRLQNVHFFIVCNWWESCCKEFLQAYGLQARKILNLIISDWLEAVKDQKFNGCIRLKILGEDWLQHSKIESFKEMDP